MNYDYEYSSSSSHQMVDVRMMSHHHNHLHHIQQQQHNHHNHNQSSNMLRNNNNSSSSSSSSSSSHNDEINNGPSHHSFECLINEVDSVVNADCIANESKSDEENDSRFNLLQNDNKQKQQQQINRNNIINLDSDKNARFLNEISSVVSNKFHYVLMAPTSPAVKANEDSLTYLNQGQNYELRINRINDSATAIQQQQTIYSQMEDIKPLIIESKLNNNKNNCSDKSQTTLNQIVCGINGETENAEKLAYNLVSNDGSGTPSGSLYLSIVRICFWDRKLQEIEHQEIKEVEILSNKP
jgi:hypothetical protein